MVADMGADMFADKVADMVVDMVADMVAQGLEADQWVRNAKLTNQFRGQLDREVRNFDINHTNDFPAQFRNAKNMNVTESAVYTSFNKFDKTIQDILSEHGIPVATLRHE
mgnify:CR=1 FL=1